jgi:uncharacterized protein Yka (UPF0111/DUF47 family)
MAQNDHYEVSDSLWGRATQYASAVWKAWGKDVDAYVEDVMDTDSRSDEECYVSTVLQDSAHSVELVAHLVGSVFSNDYTQERVKELGSVIASTESYTSAMQSIDTLETQIDKASDQFMKEHPQVQTAWMASQEKLEDAINYVTKEAQTFAKNHPEITHDIQSIVELAAVVPAAKAVKVAAGAREGIVTYTAKEAEREIGKIDLDALKPEEIEKELHRIINHLDTTPQGVHPNATTVLYSGVPKETIDALAKDKNYAFLNNTEAFKFLDNLDDKGEHPLKEALFKVHGVEAEFNKRNTPANIFINGDDSVFPRQQGAWDIISYQFVSGAKGDVLTIIGERATPQRVFSHTELEALALSKSVRQVDGMDKKALFNALDAMPSPHHQLNHFKTTHYTRNKIAEALGVEDPLALTPKQMDTFMNAATPEAKEIASKIKTFETNIKDEATQNMHKELLENRQPSSPLMPREKTTVSLTKPDVAALAGMATVAIASEEKESAETLKQKENTKTQESIDQTEQKKPNIVNGYNLDKQAELREKYLNPKKQRIDPYKVDNPEHYNMEKRIELAERINAQRDVVDVDIGMGR